MAYKITKYKGKHKIKDTKSGKSVDIDIEKFMKGGSKSAPKYNEGGCPEGMVWDAMTSECKPAQDKVWDAMTGQYKDRPQYGMVDENTREPVTAVNALQPKGLAEMSGAQITTPDISDSLKNTMSDLEGNEDVTNQTGDKNFQIANPYGGVDIPGAAHYLGKSIKDKNTLGIIGSGLKVATGLARNVVSGLGHANRYNQVMEDYYKDQKNKRNPEQYLAYGGKLDEELATGEYMHGVMNPDTEEYNAEIESGEYFQSNEGDIAEVVGDKHAQGGEKIQMEAEDRVLSDKLKLGSETAKMLSEKYDIKLKAKNTYSDVLDKFRKKSKLDKILEEEAELNKKVGEQDDVEDVATKRLNLEVLTKKKSEIAEQKHPIEEERKVIFDELFEIQEASKPKEKKTEQPNLAFGGDLDALAKEYNIPIERAQELVQNFANGGKMVPKYENGIKVGDIDPVTGKKVTKEEARKKVESGEWEDLGRGRFVDRGTPGSERVSGQALQSYRQTWDKNRFPNFNDYVDAAEKWKAENPDWNKGNLEHIPGTPDKRYYTEESPIQGIKAAGLQPLTVDNTITAPELNIPKPTGTNVEEELVIKDEKKRRGNSGIAGAYLFPDESPLPPSALQGTIKIEPRYDRVRGVETNIEPYLQEIRNRRASQNQRYEGFSPNVAAAMKQNEEANFQEQLSKLRAEKDNKDLASEEKATYTNAQIQGKEDDRVNQERLMYEMRQYKAQALTDNDQNNYYNQLQSINKNRFMDIHNLNLVNATNDDLYFDGQNFKRKQGSSDEELMNKFLRSKNLT